MVELLKCGKLSYEQILELDAIIGELGCKIFFGDVDGIKLAIINVPLNYNPMLADLSQKDENGVEHKVPLVELTIKDSKKTKFRVYSKTPINDKYHRLMAELNHISATEPECIFDAIHVKPREIMNEPANKSDIQTSVMLRIVPVENDEDLLIYTGPELKQVPIQIGQQFIKA